MRQFTRRQALSLGLGAGAAAVLAGCATPGTTSVNTAPTIGAAPAGETIRLTYWAWLKDLQKVADIWNAQNPNVQVDVVWIPGGNAGGYQKLYSALAAGGGPDIAQVELRTVPEFLLVNGLVDLSRYGADDYADLYDETLWNQVSYTGGVYAIPQDSGPMGFYYQPEILESVGAEPPATWTEWADIAKELRAAGGVYLESFPVSDASVFTAFATQAGANWLTAEDDGWVIDMTDEATLEVARFFDAAIDDDLVDTSSTPYSPGWFAAAADGGIGACTSASWGDALIEGISGGEGRWRVAPMQRWDLDGSFGSSFLGGSTSAVMANAKHPKEALDFAVWLTTSAEGIDALIENSGIGWSPAKDEIGSVREGAGSDFFGGQAYNTEVFEPATLEQNTEWTWWPITQQSFNILSDGFRRKASGVSLVDSVATAESQIMQAFRDKGLTIRKADS